MKKIFEYFRKIEMISFYPIYYYQENIMLYPDGNEKESLPLVSDPELAYSLLHSENIVTDKLEHDIFYIVNHFAEGYSCIMGPFSHLASQKDMQQRYCVQHFMKNKFSYPIKRASIEQAQNAMLLVCDILALYGIQSTSSQNRIPDLQALSQEESQQEKEEYQFQEYILNNTSLGLPQAPFSLERKFLQTLQLGEEQDFFAVLDEISQYQHGPYAPTSLKDAEYGAVMLVSHFTRAVMEVGVPPQDAYVLSDTLITNIACAHSMEEYERIISKLFRQFLRLVKKHHASEEQSPYIKKCKTYILHHLNQPLTPELLADELSVTKDYLLHLFPACEGITLMEYVRKARIQAAQNMLKYSDYDVQRIATYYQFKTQSHFSMVFKKYTGMTPMQYRKRNKPDTF